MLDERLITALHVRALRAGELHAESEPHVLFQASTIGALLDGAYDGDVSFAELRGHGDLGLGTLNGLDGEMIALEGEFMRADVDGAIHAVADTDLTPFAVVTWFDPGLEWTAPEAIGQPELATAIDARVPADRACAIRVDGSFGAVRARSVPRQRPPYRPLAEAVADQHVFTLADVEGTLVGFRFPAFSDGLEVPGYHLHVVTADRSRGGHVLDFAAGPGARVRIDASEEMHLELPPGVDLSSPELAAEAKAAIDRVERAG